jgi:hypothetical protein
MSRIYSSLSGGELFEKITEEGYTMSEAEVINYMRQVCEGVKHMHERNIIHLGTNLVKFCSILITGHILLAMYPPHIHTYIEALCTVYHYCQSK